MLDNGDANEAPSQNGGRESSAAEFLASAVEACDNGDTVLAKSPSKHGQNRPGSMNIWIF